MADPLATLEDLAARAGYDDEDRAEVLLDDASAVVRKYTGQQFTQETSSAWLKVRNGTVNLPQRPVTSVTSVADENANAVTYTYLDGRNTIRFSTTPLNSFELEPYRTPLGEVKVTYSHGYEEIPADVVAIVCNIVARALGRDPADGGITQESIEGYSYTVGTIGAAGTVGLLPDEQRALDIYRRVGGSIRVS